VGRLEKVMKVRGWFDIPGVRKGRRTLAEQMTGLETAIASAFGKTVLDIGCAEGLIAIEFARAGAQVTAIERFDVHYLLADKLVRDYNIELIQTDIMEWETERTFDIVLALAIVHKMWSVEKAVNAITARARDLVIFRWPSWITADFELTSKHDRTSTAVNMSELLSRNFRLEQTVMGPRCEAVQYWRRDGVG